jgi:hypothetical protein
MVEQLVKGEDRQGSWSRALHVTHPLPVPHINRCCASISTKYDLGWDVIYGLNPGLDCQGGQVALPAGLELCVSTG